MDLFPKVNCFLSAGIKLFRLFNLCHRANEPRFSYFDFSWLFHWFYLQKLVNNCIHRHIVCPKTLKIRNLFQNLNITIQRGFLDILNRVAH